MDTNKIQFMKSIEEAKSYLRLDGITHSMIISNKTNELYICDCSSKTVEIYKIKENYETEMIRTIELEQWNKFPKAISINYYSNEIFIGGEYDAGICVFNKSFNFKRKFGQMCFKDLDSMTTDKYMLYVTHRESNKLTKWHYRSGEKIKEINIDYPRSIIVKNNKIFVISGVYCDIDNNNNLISMKGGLNCILILGQKQMELLSCIKLDNWVGPENLKIDKFLNIYVTALKVDQTKMVSENSTLFVFNEASTFVNEFNLTSNEIYDIALFKNSIYIATYEYDLFAISNFVFQ